MIQKPEQNEIFFYFKSPILEIDPKTKKVYPIWRIAQQLQAMHAFNKTIAFMAGLSATRQQSLFNQFKRNYGSVLTNTRLEN